MAGARAHPVGSDLGPACKAEGKRLRRQSPYADPPGVAEHRRQHVWGMRRDGPAETLPPGTSTG